MRNLRKFKESDCVYCRLLNIWLKLPKSVAPKVQYQLNRDVTISRLSIKEEFRESRFEVYFPFWGLSGKPGKQILITAFLVSEQFRYSTMRSQLLNHMLIITLYDCNTIKNVIGLRVVIPMIGRFFTISFPDTLAKIRNIQTK